MNVRDRQPGIIGEAGKNLGAPPTPSEPGISKRQIAGACDRSIHAHFSVDLDAVWSMIEPDLPSLSADARRLQRHEPRL